MRTSRYAFHLISIFILIAVIFVSGSEAWYYNDDPTNHNGDTAGTAYVIDSVEALKLLRDRVNDGSEPKGKFYNLTKDLDLTAENDWVPIGCTLNDNGTIKLDNSSYYFAGHFNGNNHKITVSIDKTIRASSTGNVYSGLFGNVGGYNHDTSISNLNVSGIVRANAYTDSSTSLIMAGGITIHANDAVIDNCNFSGTVGAHAYTNNHCYVYVGGIAAEPYGYASNNVIKNCKFSGTVSAVNDGYGDVYAGGIAGNSQVDVNSCDVSSNSRVSAVVSGTTNKSSYAGGIAGKITASIIGCTSHATIADASYKGGIAGSSSHTLGNLDNRYSGALWGIGEQESDEGCTYTPLSVRILTLSLDPSYAVKGQRYETSLKASEVKGISWDVISGDLPEGITLGTSGVLSGVAVSADIYKFDVKVSVPGFDNINDTASYTLAVIEQGAPIPNNTPTNNNTNTNTDSGGSSGGGGCNYGFGAVIMMTCAGLFLNKSRRS